ncbi:MAG: AAA family ATPase [Clostridia bacterium]|nr:AAA family ATPase [Clostridia bacterium]
MRKSIVRIERIELINFKNVENGCVEFENSKDSNFLSQIMGIYGQNGSGKTALVNACDFFKKMLEGLSIPDDAYNYININSEESTLKFDLYASFQKNEYKITYEFTFKKCEDKKFVISKEKLSAAKRKENEWSSKVAIIDYDIDNQEELFTPKWRYNEILSNSKDNIVNLKVAQKITIEKCSSFIFCDEFKNIINRVESQQDLINILDVLKYFGRYNLFVISSNHTGFINMNILMPLSFRLEENEHISSGDIAVRLDNISIVKKPIFDLASNIIKQMDVVLKYIVPSLKIELYNYGEQLDEKGDKGVKVELVSKKNNCNLPLKYESEGIKKIISILSALIAMYNNPSICMVVDELDSGIFEFLLGEMLKVIENGGKGQLLFTSHNLRPLEVLSKNSLFFTTTNSKNRYIKLTNIKNNNNLRSVYIRSINLGGQKEELYDETDALEIQRAFRLAGDKLNAR